jgi:uncharacterized protein (TIGR02145 family)
MLLNLEDQTNNFYTMKKFFLIIFFGINSLGLFSQRSIMELTFTAVNSAAYVQLDSIKIMNRTQGGDTVLYWPDTVLSIYYNGIDEIPAEENVFHVFQNYPNPVADQTTISLFIPAKDKVSLVVTDILGRVIMESERMLDQGTHTFRFTPGSSRLYFFMAQWRGNSRSIKFINLSYGNAGLLEYLGGKLSTPILKIMKDNREFSFSQGDELLYIGYSNGLESGILDAPEESQGYTFQFGTNIPCHGAPTVEYEGQVYNTIQIFSQCWLKENLNVGERINGTIDQLNNGTIEKYCYNNEPDSCTKYGGLYQWWEMMQYSSQQGVRGICPPGWHLPTDEEWRVLEGAADSQYSIGDNTWDDWGWRGYDAGTNLKTTSGWYYNSNNTDLFGFSGLPGGERVYGDFDYIGGYGNWWSSTEYFDLSSWYRSLSYGAPEVGHVYYDEAYGFSVRCLRDY